MLEPGAKPRLIRNRFLVHVMGGVREREVGGGACLGDTPRIAGAGGLGRQLRGEDVAAEGPVPHAERTCAESQREPPGSPTAPPARGGLRPHFSLSVSAAPNGGHCPPSVPVTALGLLVTGLEACVLRLLCRQVPVVSSLAGTLSPTLPAPAFPFCAMRTSPSGRTCPRRLLCLMGAGRGAQRPPVRGGRGGRGGGMS